MAAGRKRAGARCRTGRWVLGDRVRSWALVDARSSALARQPTHVLDGFVPYAACCSWLAALMVARSFAVARQPTHVPGGFVPYAACCSCLAALMVARSSASARQPTHVPGGFVPPPCGPVPFLCLPKEKEPKETAPLGPRSRAHRARVTARVRCGGLPTVHPCTAANAARSLAPPLRACPARPRRGPQGRGQSRAAIVVAPAASQAQYWLPTSDAHAALGVSAMTDRNNGHRVKTLRVRFARGADLNVVVLTLSILAGSQCSLGRAGARYICRCPSAAAGGGRSGPQGERDGSRSLRRQHMEVLSAQPAADRGPRAQDAREATLQGLPFSLVTFSWASKRKTPARRDAGRTHQGRESVLAPQRTTEQTSAPPSMSSTPRAERTHQGRESVVATTSPPTTTSAQPSTTPHTP